MTAFSPSDELFTVARLRSLVAVAEQRSFSLAGHDLFTTQSAVSQHIQALEAGLGLRLFDRRPRDVTLTEAGQRVYQHACAVLRSLRQIRADLETLTGVEHAALAVGGGMTTGIYVLPELLGRFRQRVPAVQPTVHIGQHGDLVAGVLEGRLHAALVERFERSDLVVAEPLLRDKLVLVLSPRHPLAERETVTLSELAAEPFIARELGSSTRRLVATQVARAGARLSISMELGHTEAVKRAVQAGLGVSLLSQRAVAQEQRAGTLVVRPTPELDLARSFYLVHAAERPLTPMAERFLDFARMDVAAGATDPAHL